ncbi:MAG: Cys-tRNA(Pro) deacylase [Ectothiorhodospiraceae bacterium]
MTPAVVALERAGIDFRVHAYQHDPRSPSYGLEAAEALSLPPERVYKTLIAALGDGTLVTAVVPVNAELDLKKLAAAAGAKRAAMAKPADAERATGYVTGGISPFGQKRRLPTYLDDSARDKETIHVSAGRRGLEIELAPAALIQQCGGRFAAIARAGGR